VLRLTVYGTAIPQGSSKAFYIPKLNRAVITSDNSRLKPWRQAIVDAAREQLAGAAPLEDCAVEVLVTFYLPRPASAPKRYLDPWKKPDEDKLLRALFDAFTAAGVWRDDAQVVHTDMWKAFAGSHRDPLGPAGVPRLEVVAHALMPQPEDAPCSKLSPRRRPAPQQPDLFGEAQEGEGA
jgi:Holliday junction resolvase RusA-like endonuclease